MVSLNIQLIRAMQSDPPVCSSQAPIDVAVQVMQNAGIGCVIALDDQRIVGVFTERDLVDVIASESCLPDLLLEDLMLPPAIILNESDLNGLAAVLEIVQHCDINCLPVVNQSRHLVGIITPQSLLKALTLGDAPPLSNCERQEEAEKFLREGEETFKTLVANSPGVFYRSVFTEQWHQVFVDESVYDLTGYASALFAEQGDRSLMNLIYPEDIDSVREAVSAALQGHQPYCLTYRIVRADGCTRWIQDRGQGCFNDDKLLWVDGFFFDITDGKAQDDLIRESEQLFRSIYEHSHESIFVVDVLKNGDFQFVQLNPAHERLTGISTEFLRGKTPEQVLAADDAIAIRQHYQTCVEARTSISYEETVSFQGELSYWLTSLTPLFDDAGRVFRLVGVCTHINDLKLTEIALQTSEQRFRAIFENAGIGVVVLTAPEYKMTLSNLFFQTLVGYSADELAHLHLYEITHPDDWVIEAPLIQECLAGRCDRIQVEKRCIAKAGKLVWVNLISTLMRDETGQIQYAIGMVEDITARKQAEKFLRQYERIVSATPDAMLLVDRQYIYQLVNQPYLNWNNKPYEDIVGHSISELLGKEVFEQIIKPRLDRCFAGEVVQYEEWFTYAALGRRFISLTYAPYIEPDGTISGVVVCSRDLTELKQAEEALLQREREFRALVESSPDIVSRIDHHFRFLYVNPRVEIETGILTSHWLGKTELELGFPSEVVEPWYNALRHTFETGRERSYESIFPKADGTLKYWLCRIVPEFGEDGSVVSVLTISRDISDRWQMEEALAQSERQYRLLFENNPNPMWIYDSETLAFLAVNQAAIAHYGYSETEFLAMTILDIRPHGEIPSLLSHLATSASVTRAGEWVHCKKDGQVISVDITSHAISWRGQPARFVAARDVTERKQMAEALRRSEVRNRAFLAAIPDLINLSAADGSYIELISPQPEIDLVPESVDRVGRSLTEIIPIDIATRQIEAIRMAIATKAVQIYEQQVWIGDRKQYEEVRVSPCDQHSALVIVRDITDRKHAEEALIESRELFRRAFEGAATGIKLVGLDGRLLKVNPAMCTITGFSETELLLLRLQDLMHSDDVNDVIRAFQQLISSDVQSVQLEKRYIHQQGHDVWVLMNTSVVCDRAGSPLYFVSQVQDISDRKAIERMKDEFISIVSHELRTPLTAIRGALGLLATGIYHDKPDKSKRMFDIALADSDRLMRLVNDILDLERLRSGNIPLSFEVCLVADLMQRAVDSIEAIANDASIIILTHSITASVWANSDAILQTLTNLLSNAIKFSPQNSTIWLRASILSDESQAKPQVLFSVRDQGRGIPADKIETIFEQFQQVDVSDSRQKGGTGLGLAICQNIIHRHQGRIWAESKLDAGSTFYFTVPCAEQDS